MGDVVYAAMTATLDVPIGDWFQAICEYESTHLVTGPHYLGIERTADAVIIQVTLSEGRTAGQKKAFYKAIGELVTWPRDRSIRAVTWIGSLRSQECT